MDIKRLWIIVLDSFGVGALPDAAEFGDHDCHTLQTIVRSDQYDTPYLKKLGMFNIDGVDCGEKEAAPLGAFGRCRELSRGKDTTTGHWEIAGIISQQAMPTFPDGFPAGVIAQLEKAFGRRVLCNKPYSGTQVIHDYGQEHERTGALIVYTSADSVLQIAAHESVVPPEELYGYCRMARKILTGPYAVGRVIARPFVGTYPDDTRTKGRHDFSLLPPSDTMLDALVKGGLDTIGIGKISDIFAGRGIGRHIPIAGNIDGMEKTLATQKDDFHGLCFVNLVDFDMEYGHRRNVDGYAAATTVFDCQLGDFLPAMQPEDVLLITADHGCDPAAPGTDHTREHTPALVYGAGVKAGVNLGTRRTFADIAATVAEMFGVPLKTAGTSFWPEIRK